MAREKDLKHRQALWGFQSLIPRISSMRNEAESSYSVITQATGKKMKMLFYLF